MELKEAMEIAEKNGFTYVSALDAGTIELLDEVRAMCNANNCRRYQANWSCPPACGELSECREKVEKFKVGILVQTVGDVEDSLDFEAMVEIEKAHKDHFYKTAEELKKAFPELLALGAGSCTLCKICTYPDAPCRFPEKRVSSLEAYGILVSELCRRNQMDYYYGPEKMAYTSCYLLE